MVIGVNRAEKSWGERCFYRLCRWAEWFPEAIATVFPKTQVQLCIVHMVRHSLAFVSWKDRKAVVADLKVIYQSVTVEEAALELERFAQLWDKQYPSISASWRKHWVNLIAFFDYPEAIRKIIYTTNAIESLNEHQ